MLSKLVYWIIVLLAAQIAMSLVSFDIPTCGTILLSPRVLTDTKNMARNAYTRTQKLLDNTQAPTVTSFVTLYTLITYFGNGNVVPLYNVANHLLCKSFSDEWLYS